MSTHISERANSLLKQLVERYIRDGQPVGSKTLASSVYPALSPATIRKVLSDLEEQGYIRSPHTSSGRIPTTRGIRFFVDSLLSVHPLGESEVKRMEAEFEKNQCSDSLISDIPGVLSELTHMVGVVTLPKVERQLLRHVEFLPLSEHRVLVILVFSDGGVQNQVIVTGKEYQANELAVASNFLNQHFVGKDLKCARHELLETLKQERSEVDSLMKSLLEVASAAFVPQPPRQEYVLAGQQNLFANPSISVEQLRQVFEAFTQKQQILHLLDQCLHGEGIQVFIGEESGYDAFRQHSIITSRYTVDGEVVGVLGVIGPTRMRYDKVIPVVEFSARALGSHLKSDG